MIGLQNKVVGDVFSASKVSSLDHVYFLCTWDMLISISLEYLITYNKNYLPLIKIKQCFSIFLLHNLFQTSFFGVCFLCVAYSGIWLKNFSLVFSSSHVHPDVKLSVESSFPHYAHSGILGAAHDLFMQIDGNPGDYGKNITFSTFQHYLVFFFLYFVQ